jgi:hypothetical protein
MRRTYLVLLSLAWSAVPIPSSAQSVSGVVSDFATGRPLAGASLALADSSGAVVTTTVTDSVGHYHLQARASGRYAIRVRILGYAPATIDSLDLPLASRSRRVDFSVRRLTTEAALQSVLIEERRESLRNRRVLGENLRSTSGEIITEYEVDEAREGAINALDVVRAVRLPGLRLNGDICTISTGFTRRRGAFSLNNPLTDAPLNQDATAHCLPIHVDEVLMAEPGDPVDSFYSAMAQVRPDELAWVYLARSRGTPVAIFFFTKRFADRGLRLNR